MPRVVLALLLLCAWSSLARAQAPGRWFTGHLLFPVQTQALARPKLALWNSGLAAAVPLQREGPDAASRMHQNRARRILAAGAGFVLSAAVTAAYVLPNRAPCWGSDVAKGSGTLKGAVVVGTVGLSLALGGGAWFGVESRRHGYYASRRERLIAMGIGAITFAIGQTFLLPLFAVDRSCST
jgi:hypothetical protein